MTKRVVTSVLLIVWVGIAVFLGYAIPEFVRQDMWVYSFDAPISWDRVAVHVLILSLVVKAGFISRYVWKEQVIITDDHLRS